MKLKKKKEELASIQIVLISSLSGLANIKYIEPQIKSGDFSTRENFQSTQKRISHPLQVSSIPSNSMISH